MDQFTLNKRNYTAEKIYLATHCLVSGWGELPERVKEAHGYLLRCSYRDGLESQFETIENSLSSVVKGDYSKVSRQQFYSVADAVHEMESIVKRWSTCLATEV